MTSKRGRTENDLDAEGPSQRRQRLAEAVPDMVVLPPKPPSGPKPASMPLRKVRFIPTNAEILAMTDERRKQYRQGEWLNRSSTWDEFTTPGGGTWKGVRVLGQGTYGIAGLFKYDGPNKEIPQSIVVKQCGADARHALIRESRILAELALAGSSHIIKLFKSIFYTAGTGAHPRWDPIPYVETVGADGTKAHTYEEQLQVSKIYLEYCEEGDLWHYSRDHYEPGDYPTEEFIWRTLECYVRALSVLATGYEDPWKTDPPLPDVPDLRPKKGKRSVKLRKVMAALTVCFRCFMIDSPATPAPENSPEPEPPNRKSSSTGTSTGPVTPPESKIWLPIAHFDIKTDNLFLGKADKDHQNPKRYVHKFADFGMARHVRDTKSLDFQAYGYFCGATGFKAPEQMYQGGDNGNIGLPGNIWSTAATIYALITKSIIPERSYKVTFIDGRGQSELYNTQGALLLSLRRNLYSNTLLNLLMRCLAFNTADRPSLSAMKKTIDGALAVFDLEKGAKAKEIMKNPFFDFNADNLVRYPERSKKNLPLPQGVAKIRRVDSLLDDFAYMVQDIRARVDLVGFAPAGSASDTVDGNTAGYSVRPVKFDLIPSTPTLKEQQKKKR